MQLAALAIPDSAVVPVPRIAYLGCPLCWSKNLQLTYTADCSRHALYDPIIPCVMQWMVCEPCGHEFTEGHFALEHYEALFAKAHQNQLPGFNLEPGRHIAGRIVERVAQYANTGGWLDVGFGDGSLLMAAEEFGFETIGIDGRAAAVDRLRQFGIEAHVAHGAYPTDRKFSVVSMADVLEHMPFPKDALNAVRGLLIDDGALFLSCPNSDNAAWRHVTEQGRNPYMAEIEHFHNFSRSRLYDLLAECGFMPKHFAFSERYRMGMEIVAVKAA